MLWFWLLVLIGVVGGGFYAYFRLSSIEREIRVQLPLAKGETEVETTEKKAPDVQPAVAFEPEVPSTSPVEITDDLDAVSLELIAVVQQQVGILQSEIYAQFGTLDRREVQNKLRQLDQRGILKREKKGNSYQLFPL